MINIIWDVARIAALNRIFYKFANRRILLPGQQNVLRLNAFCYPRQQNALRFNAFCYLFTKCVATANNFVDLASFIYSVY